MPVESKTNGLKRTYPEENGVPKTEEKTENVLTTVVTLLESQEKPTPRAVESGKGAVPPPNTPSTKD